MSKLKRMAAGLLSMLCIGNSILCCGASYVPSVEQKGAPEVTEATDADNNDVTDILAITPYGDRDSMQEYKQDNFEEAYDDISTEKAADEVRKGIESGEVSLPKGADVSNVTVDGEHLSITDIFYVHEKDDSGIINPGVEITMETSASDNGLIAVMHYDGTDWKVIPCTRNDDGTVTFVAEEFGPYLFITNTVVETMGESEPVSPQTGEEETPVSVIAVTSTILVLAAAGTAAVIRKRHHES